jgi:ketol-acid reductoisomerase
MSRVQEIEATRATVDGLRGRCIAVLGYGAQGHAHALNLRDSELDVLVAQRPGGARFAAAVRDGFTPVGIEEAVQRAEVLIFGLPDDAAPAIYESQIKPLLRTGQTLGFIHGFVIHYRTISPPPDVDVILVAPKAQGRGVRNEFVAGRGVVSLVAVHRNATGRALETALGWAAGIGSARAGILETTFQDETETDLFGEQAVLCGGLTALIKAGFETLVEAGYPEELAYFECCHEIKLLADLICEHGIGGMRERISSTARYGDVTRGPRIVGDASRSAMRELLREIRSEEFAREFLEDANNRVRSRVLVETDRSHAIERVGAKLRMMMRGGRDAVG